MEECVFCKIIKREVAGRIIVYEDDSFIAIISSTQVAKGHTLVIPKKHSVNILDIDSETLKGLSVVSQQIAQRLVKEDNATGINLLHAAGKDAQQSVFHFHFHLIPRYPNDGMDLWVKKESK